MTFNGFWAKNIVKKKMYAQSKAIATAHTDKRR